MKTWAMVVESPCGCWDLNSGPSEEQLVLFTAEPSLQPTFSIYNTWLLHALCYRLHFEVNSVF
ncbi:mCG1044125, isoform CRA_b [Mus musculus]|nr:mCG1044125, isoform CRA_b [Mus musculus]